MTKSKVKSPVIRKTRYSSDVLAEVDEMQLNEKDKKLLLRYPTVYVIQDLKSQQQVKYKVYVGETNNIVRRTNEHLKEDRNDFKALSKSDSAEMFIIGHEFFNKSLTLDIENRFLHYLSSVDAVETIHNRRENPQDEYFTSEHMGEIFSKIWKKLHKDNATLFPSEAIIRDSALFKASPFHKLSPEQIQAKEEILNQIFLTFDKNESGQLILVEGEAGTGKTVLMSSLLYDVFTDEDFTQSEDDLSAYLLVNHNEQRVVYEQLAKKLGLKNPENKECVLKPSTFINRMRKSDKKADIVIIDEAHLLLTQGNQGYSGKNQLKDILSHSKVVVAVYDKKQILSGSQFWEEGTLEELRKNAQVIQLKNQMRINAAPSTIDWLQGIIRDLEIKPYTKDDSYDLRVFISPTEMLNLIKERNLDQGKGISRLVATYDWDYSGVRKPDNQEFWTVDIGKFSMPWNLQIKPDSKVKELSWAEQPQTINEIGSTYTIQGFDLNYAGVIIGPSVKYRDGRIVFDKLASSNNGATNRRTLADGTKVDVSEELLRNELNVLLSRGVNGLYLYAVDEELQKALVESICMDKSKR